jgi:hypothetical protein
MQQFLKFAGTHLAAGIEVKKISGVMIAVVSAEEIS